MGTLANVGNTCGINTLIQCMTYTPFLRRFILERETDNHRSLSFQFKDVINGIYNKKVSLSPSGLVSSIHENFKDLIAEFEQTDIGELWQLIANKIGEENPVNISEERFLREIADIHPMQQTIEKKLRIINNKNLCVWLRNIQGIQLSIIKCNNDVCDECSWIPEVFTSIPVDVSNTDHCDLAEILLQYFNVESMNEWKCEKCKNIGAQKQSQIWSMPEVLVLNLKRFHIDDSHHIRKLYTEISITEQINFNLNSGTHIFNYQLTAVGNHYGSYHGGHYNAICNVGDNKWMEFDDLNVKEVNTDFLLNNRDAYILFYKKI